ncbi:MAG TPA: SDR family oxidoreductase, partial [Candidatus Dormibacteraeota bacterium]
AGDRRHWCALGSVKGNIGHMGPAAGAAGLIKAALVLERRQIPASINFEAPNPRIDFAESAFFVNTELREWEDGDRPRRAGVSSFGIGGTNAHLILEEAPEPEPAAPARSAHLLVVSARTEAALETACANLAAHLAEHPEQDLADVAYTLQAGRARHRHRRALACRSADDAGHLTGGRRAVTGTAEGGECHVAFLFPGQGTQYVGMGAELHAGEPAFRAAFDECARLLRPHLGLDLGELVFAGAAGVEEATRLLTQTRITQPAVFAVEYALARLLLSWGVVPHALIGHSIGEYVAACLAGVFGLEEALEVVAARGALMQALPGGSMLAVPMDEESVRGYLGEALSLAAVNAPRLCVVSGPDAAVDELEDLLGRQGLNCPRLRTSHAFHSAMMDPILADFAERVRRVPRRAPAIPFVSNLTGTWITDEQAVDPEYWSAHLRGCVRFADGVPALLADPRMALVEVGPGQTLSGLVAPQAGPDRVVVPTLRHPQRAEPDLLVTLRAVGALWAAGASVDWEAFNAPHARGRTPLPGYPYQRSRHWVEPEAEAARPSSRFRVPEGQKLPLEDAFSVPVWRETAPPVDGDDALDPVQGPFLLLADAGGTGELLADSLRRRGHEVVVAVPGDALERLGDDTYRFDPRRWEQYDELLGGLGERAPRTVVHLVSLAGTEAPLTDQAAAAAARELSYSSLCALAQALARHERPEPRRVVVVTGGAHEVVGGDGVNPAAATALGPVGVAPKELIDVEWRAVDVEGRPGPATVERLRAEVRRACADPLVALRGRRRFVRAFEERRLTTPGRYAERVRAGGTYLVTGGLGAVGLTLAEQLATAAPGAHLVMLGRTRFPEPDAWDAWVAEHGEGDRVSRQIGQLRALRNLGADPVTYRADVADAEQVREVVRAVRARFGRVDGVIHAAGLGGGGMLLAKTPENHAEVLRPKVDGTLALAAALADDPPDFLVLCSSIVAISGDFGLVDYCAANCFLDAFAAAAQAAFPGVVAVDWPAWQEIGMAVEAASGAETLLARTAGSAVEHPVLQRRLLATGSRITFESTLTPASHWMLDEHRIEGSAIMPGVGYLEMGRGAFALANGEQPIELRDVVFTAPLDIGERRDVRVTLEPGAQRHTFTIAADGSTFATGQVATLAQEPPEASDLGAIEARLDRGEVRVRLEDHVGVVKVGAHWDSIERVVRGEREELAFLRLAPEHAGDVDRHVLHPSLLDCATSFSQTITPEGDYLPFGYGSVRVWRSLPAAVVSHIRHREDGSSGEFHTVDVTVTDPAGQVLVEIEGFSLRRVERVAVSRGLRAPAMPATTGDEFSEIRLGVTPAEAVEAFRRILGHDLGPEVVVCPESLERKLERTGRTTQKRIMEALAAARPAAGGGTTRRDLDIPFVEPANDLERQLADLWSETLGVSPIGVEDDLYSLGGNSLIAVQLASRVRERFQIELALTSLFDRPHVRGLAEAIQEALLQRVEQMSEDEAAALLQSLGER